MFRNIRFIVCFQIIVLALFGCSGVSSVETGLQVSETLVVDNEYDSEIHIEPGDIFAVDMNNPLPKGYRLTGASFDPDLLRMERFIEYEDGGMRARYIFSTLGAGTTDVLIKMRAISGGEEEVFKHVTVIVGGESEGWFF